MPAAKTPIPSLGEAARDPARSAQSARSLRQVAAAGVAGGGTAFPYAKEISHAFGRFAPQRMHAVSGPRAAMAAEAMDAEGFAFGPVAAFAASPSLATAAHEAAHIAAAERGVRVPGGVGAPGDRHERVAEDAAAAVTAGRSAEPVFAAAYGDAPVRPDGPPQLQMKNSIKSKTYTTVHTPWKQISDQLDLDPFQYLFAFKMTGGYQQMVATLGDSCDRAQSVTAELDGTRNGGPRTGDATQTAYGNIGNFMSLATNTPTPYGEAFEGGHLVSDEILGTDSYVQYNFAPQRSSLNSPHYRQIETLAAEGAEHKTSGTKAPKWKYEVDLSYDHPTINVPTATVANQLGIPKSAVRKNPIPSQINLTTWVPHLWKAKLTALGTDEVFKGESKVDTAQTSGVGKGYLGTEQDVAKKSIGLFGGLSDTQKYIDTTYWSMDSMKYGVTGGTPTQRSTGTGLDRQASHSWTGVQSPPRGQTATNTGGKPPLPPVTVPTVPKLQYQFSFTQGLMDFSTPSSPMVVVPTKPHEPFGKANKRFARRFKGLDSRKDTTQSSYESALSIFRDELMRLPPQKQISRKELLRAARKRKGNARQKRQRVESMDTLLFNLAPKTKKYIK